MKKTEESDGFSVVEHKHESSVASLEYAHFNKSHMLQRMNEKHLPSSYLATKHSNHNKLRVSRIQEKPVNLSHGTKRAFTLASEILGI